MHDYIVSLAYTFIEIYIYIYTPYKHFYIYDVCKEHFLYSVYILSVLSACNVY